MSDTDCQRTARIKRSVTPTALARTRGMTLNEWSVFADPPNRTETVSCFNGVTHDGGTGMSRKSGLLYRISFIHMKKYIDFYLKSCVATFPASVKVVEIGLGGGASSSSELLSLNSTLSPARVNATATTTNVLSPTGRRKTSLANAGSEIMNRTKTAAGSTQNRFQPGGLFELLCDSVALILNILHRLCSSFSCFVVLCRQSIVSHTRQQHGKWEYE